MVVPKYVRIRPRAADTVLGSATGKRGGRDASISGPVDTACSRRTSATNRPTRGKQSIPWSPGVLLQTRKLMVIGATGILSGQDGKGR